jgi:hypothetical protein
MGSSHLECIQQAQKCVSVCVDVAWMCHKLFFVHFTHTLSTKHDGIFIPAATSPTKMPTWSPPQSRRLPLQPCHTPATLQHSIDATLQHSIDATPITSASIATAKTTGLVVCCVFTSLLAFFLLLCCPLSHELVLSPQPTATLRGRHCPPPAAKSAKTEAMVDSLI